MVELKQQTANCARDGHGRPSWPYVAPFGTYIFLFGIQSLYPIDPRLALLVRFILCSVVLLSYSRGVLQFRPRHIIGTLLVGALVFAIWVAPDAMWPVYRHHWLFDNAVFGAPRSSLPSSIRIGAGFLILRLLNSVVLVPIVEELFWRAWVMRLLIAANFEKVPLGSYLPESFWLTGVLFALEHGSYWDVGLLAGIAYNLWMVRTRSLADCILAHALTNGLLAAYVIVAGKWEYWL